VRGDLKRLAFSQNAGDGSSGKKETCPLRWSEKGKGKFVHKARPAAQKKRCPGGGGENAGQGNGGVGPEAPPRGKSEIAEGGRSVQEIKPRENQTNRGKQWGKGNGRQGVPHRLYCPRGGTCRKTRGKDTHRHAGRRGRTTSRKKPLQGKKKWHALEVESFV